MKKQCFYYLLDLAKFNKTKISTKVTYNKPNGCYIVEHNRIELEIKSPFSRKYFFKENFFKYSWNNSKKYPPKFELSLEDIITLAHELGHAFSDSRKFTDPKEYLQVNFKFRFGFSLDFKDKRKILKEEKRAWAFARIFLKNSQSFNQWEEFYAIRDKSLNSYKTLLNLK